MDQTGEPYTAALGAIRGPDVPAGTTKQGEPAMNDVDRLTSQAPTPVEGTSIPVLPARDIAETLALYERLGFAVSHDEENGYGMVRRGSIELHFTASPDLDPWNSAGMAFVRLNDATALYEELVATGAVPLVSLLRPAELVLDELRAKWDAGDSIARMGEIADRPWGIREFPLLDCNNNLIRFGQLLN
jgi:hypothetical protein